VPAGTTAEVRSLPPRNVSFLGREKELLEIEEGLTAHNSLVIQAAEQPQLLGDQFTQLAIAAGVSTPEADDHQHLRSTFGD
jgi:hypothetical protein